MGAQYTSSRRRYSMRTRLERNGFIVHECSVEQAADVAMSLIREGSSVGLGGSLTVEETGLKSRLKQAELEGKLRLYDQYSCKDREESLRIRHLGMDADVFVTGTNAITETGELVNVDGYGNRVCAQILGPRQVIILCGTNKIVKDVPGAIERIRKIAPLNARRLGKKTPCAVTGICSDCDSPDRICNYTTIIHKGKGKIHIIIVDKALGF